MIQRYEEQYDYLLDPHTAVGVGVAEQHPASVPTICLATAHPAKFTQTMEQAIGRSVHHTILDALEGAPTRCAPIANDREAVQRYVVEHI